MIGSHGKRRPFGNEKPDGPDLAGNEPAFTKKRPYRWLNQLYDRCCFPRVFGTRSDPDQPPRSAWISASLSRDLSRILLKTFAVPFHFDARFVPPL